MLVIESLEKVYPNGTRANDGIRLSIERGELFGLLGPNGAGKTTLVSQIAGYLKPSSGNIHINGKDVVRHPALSRRYCSMQPQGQINLGGMKARDAVQIVGRIRGGKGRAVAQRQRELFRNLALEEWAGMAGENLSGGVKRLLTFCMAAIEPSDIVILDEPTNDVDPERRQLLWREIRSLRDRGSAVFLITHNVHEAAASVERLAIIDHGRIQALGTPSDIACESSLEEAYIRIARISAQTARTGALESEVSA